MNREMKFRCRTDMGTWVYFTLQDLVNIYSVSAITGEEIADLVDDQGNKTDRFNLKKSQQYTGFRDKNGEEIYEGDVLNISGCVGRVFYDFEKAGFSFEGTPNHWNKEWYERLLQAEIIGTTYEI